jgi:hypothetical protein
MTTFLLAYLVILVSAAGGTSQFQQQVVATADMSRGIVVDCSTT